MMFLKVRKILRKIHKDTKGGASLLLVFMISIMALTLISAVASYSLVFYRNHFRVKESYKMVEVMENMAKIVRRAYDRQQVACDAGFSTRNVVTGAKTTAMCFSTTQAQRCVPDPENPAVTYCIENINTNILADKGKQEPVFEIVKKGEDKTPWMAKFGYKVDVALNTLQGLESKPFNPHRILSSERAYAQGVIAGETWAPAAAGGNIASVRVIDCSNAVQRAAAGENFCMSCDGTDPADDIGSGTGSVRCVTFQTCAGWETTTPCPAGSIWRQRIAIIDSD